MDRGAWWSTVHRAAELEMTEATGQQEKCNLKDYVVIIKLSYKSVTQRYLEDIKFIKLNNTLLINSHVKNTSKAIRKYYELSSSKN